MYLRFNQNRDLRIHYIDIPNGHLILPEAANMGGNGRTAERPKSVNGVGRSDREHGGCGYYDNQHSEWQSVN